MAVTAAHAAALQKYHGADTRSVYQPKGLQGMHMTHKCFVLFHELSSCIVSMIIVSPEK